MPWIFDNELVTDRRTKALSPGTIAVLEDGERNALVQVAVNPNSRIMARVMERDLNVPIDRAWLAARLKHALELRETLFDAPYYRLIPCRGRWHAPVLSLTGSAMSRWCNPMPPGPM